MRDNRSDLIMVQSTIALAHSLGRTVVAEGVEDPQSLEQLTMLKCDIAQGFVVGRPMSFEEPGPPPADRAGGASPPERKLGRRHLSEKH